MRAIEEKITVLRNEITRESKLRADSIDNLNQCLEVNIFI